MATQIVLDGHSTTDYVLTWLDTARQPHVLQVFDRVCNLIDSEGRVISLVTPEIGNGPFNLGVSPVKFSDYVTPTCSVQCRRDTLIVGDLTINVVPGQLWDSRFPQRLLSTLPDYVPLLIAVLKDLSPPESLAGLVVDLPEPASPLERALLDTAADYAGRFITGLLTLDRSSCHEGAIGLAGLGGGLTPAGDDWIMGCALAVQVGLFDPEVVSLVKWAVESAAKNTTPLSAAWLRSLAQGRCSAHWHSFFDAIRKESDTLVRAAATKITREGHTSGCDALAGYVSILVAQNNSHGAY